MRVASVHVGNWGLLSQFRTALQRRGDWGNVDALVASIPSGNGGSTTATAASEALAQLEAFASSSFRWTAPKLIDATTKEVVGEGVGEPDGLFVFAGSLEGGLDLHGRFFVRQQQTGALLFRAATFTQELIADSDGSPVAATLVSDAQSLTWPIVLTAGTGDGEMDQLLYPARLRVVFEVEGPMSFERIVSPLRAVLTAAVVHDHPVHWT